MSHSANILCGT